jgi:hypothetical protein
MIKVYLPPKLMENENWQVWQELFIGEYRFDWDYMDGVFGYYIIFEHDEDATIFKLKFGI